MGNIDELYHYGIKGMKWGIRRSKQTATGSVKSSKDSRIDSNKPNKKKGLSKKNKTAIKVGAAVVGTALATYGAYKVSKYLKGEAARRSYETGKKYAEEHFFSGAKKVETINSAKYRSLMDGGFKTLRNTDARTKKVSKSTIDAVKYLRHPERYIVDGDLIRWNNVPI